ncbi:MAG: STAS-like domain-containing protein [Chloroflexi bacterium]|nr:STAS-like domain-containing protein [Chloroflexota bacterium]
MSAVKVYDLLGRRVLVTRESAKAIGPALRQALSEDQQEVALDFSGVDGVTPSFLDEVVAIIEALLGEAVRMRVILLNPPTRLSLKFQAVGRAHGVLIRELDNGNWLLVKGASENEVGA